MQSENEMGSWEPVCVLFKRMPFCDSGTEVSL
jgi:hypothetical protein